MNCALSVCDSPVSGNGVHGKGPCKGPGEFLQTFMSGTANHGFSKMYFPAPMLDSLSSCLLPG